jgi:hypothetical protein
VSAPLGHYRGSFLIEGEIVSAGTEDSAATANGSRPDESDWRSIFDAPDFTQLVRPAQTATAREYSAKVKSMLKSGLVGAINIGDFPDAATILEYGPSFADATGQLADSSDWAKKAVDVITSPGNPVALFVMTTIPLVSQLFRNHEDVIRNIPQNRKEMRRRRKAMATAHKAEPPRFTIRFMKREWPVRFRLPKVGKVLAGFKSQTRDPEALTLKVFTDPLVIRALKKQGIVLVNSNEQPPTA